MATMYEDQLSLQLDLEARFAVVLQPLLEEASFAALEEQVGRTKLVQADLLRSSLVRVWDAAASGGAGLVMAEAGRGFKEKKESFITSFVTEYFDTYGEHRLAMIEATTQKQVREAFIRSMMRGATPTEAYVQVSETLAARAEARAKTIAGTEVHSMLQFASYKTALRSVIPLNKTWHSVIDDRTRGFSLGGRQDLFNHRVMNGVSTGLHHYFLVPTLTGAPEALRFPGDPAGSAGNVINCRCMSSFSRV